MPTDPIVSTGRGGAGNIGPDPTVYTDGEIIREGIQGHSDPGKETYSTGRGGAGNIGSPRLAPTQVPSSGIGTGVATPLSGAATPRSQDIVPEPALRAPGADYANYHTGRGGEGNVHREKYDGHSGPRHGQPGEGETHKESLGEKVKGLFHKDAGAGQKEREKEAAAAPTA